MGKRKTKHNKVGFISKMSSRVAGRSRYSRSRSRSPRYTRRYSRSRSRSGSPRGGPSGGGGASRYGGRPGPSREDRRGRSHSRSPMSNRRRHVGSRDAPETSNCVGAFGLSLYTTERELEKEFSKFGPLEKVTVVLDGKTGRSRGFAFVYYESQEDAKAAKEAMCDQEIDGRRIRVDFSITKRSHTPTPGVYMGRPTYQGESRGGVRGGGRGGGRDRYRDDDRGYRGGGGRDRYGGGGGDRRRSPSPYHRAERR